MISIVVDCSEDFKKQAEYTFKNIFEILGFPFKIIKKSEINKLKSEILIYYGNETLKINSSIRLISIFSTNYIEIDKTEINFRFLNKKKLPFLFANHDLKPLKKSISNYEDKTIVSREDNFLKIDFDLIASIFYFLSLDIEDNKNFHKIKNIPVVDKLISFLEEFLIHSLKSLDLELKKKKRFPKNYDCAIILSHDVDRLRNFTLTKLKRRIKEFFASNPKKDAISNSIKLTLEIFKSRNWTDNFNYILDLEDKYNAESTFFVVTNGNSENDPSYRKNPGKLEKKISKLIGRKADIQLHGSYKSYANKGLLSQGKEKLDKIKTEKFLGIRYHYLQFDKNKTPNLLDELNFDYDSTLGFRNTVGYRCGTSFPYKLFSSSKKNYCFYELPLVLMDTPFILKNKMNLNSKSSWKIVKKYLEETKRNNSCLSVNWHQSIINEMDITGFSELYEKILKWGKANDVWMTSPTKFIDWWKNKR